MFKKLHNIMFITLLTTSAIYAQVGVGTTTPNAAAALEIQSTDKVFLPPRLTETQMNNVANPPEGGLVYCTNCTPKGLYYYNSLDFVSSGSGVPSGLDATTEVYSSTGKIWLNKNLGATQVATSSLDHMAYGSLFQWGRSDDGHEVMNWTSSTGSDGTEQTRETAVTSATDVPGHDDFITNTDDWRTLENTALWQGVSGTNNPCPSGFRIPTNAEWTAERATWSSSDSEGAFASVLKLPLPGVRVTTTGDLTQVSISGNYWSSTTSFQRSNYTAITSTFASTFNGQRSFGFSVRCIKD